MTYAGLTALAAHPIDLSAILCPHGATAVDIAMLLFLASPQRAREFALSMHERAVWHADHTCAELWSGVVVELKRMLLAQQPA